MALTLNDIINAQSVIWRKEMQRKLDQTIMSDYWTRVDSLLAEEPRIEDDFEDVKFT